MTAKADDVRYVEGVWTEPWRLADADDPTPHAWITIEGYRVDLMDEFFAWRDPETTRMLYEPTREYSHQELTAFFKNETPDCFSIGICSKMFYDDSEIVPEHLHSGYWDANYESVASFVFQPALSRLKARYPGRRDAESSPENLPNPADKIDGKAV